MDVLVYNYKMKYLAVLWFLLLCLYMNVRRRRQQGKFIFAVDLHLSAALSYSYIIFNTCLTFFLYVFIVHFDVFVFIKVDTTRAFFLKIYLGVNWIYHILHLIELNSWNSGFLVVEIPWRVCLLKLPVFKGVVTLFVYDHFK